MYLARATFERAIGGEAQTESTQRQAGHAGHAERCQVLVVLEVAQDLRGFAALLDARRHVPRVSIDERQRELAALVTHRRRPVAMLVAE